MGLAVLLGGPRLLYLPEHEPGRDHGVDVLREGAIESRHDELGRLRRGVGEASAINPAGGIEIVTDDPVDLDPSFVADPA